MLISCPVVTVVTTDTAPVRAARDAFADGGDGWMDTGPRTAGKLEAVREGWPEEFGGGPRCRFCRDPRPEWSYNSADVDLLTGEPAIEWVAELPVLGTELMGRVDWDACDICHRMIETDYWYDLVRRHGGDLGAPMPVQAARAAGT